ncbi:hypothetical protein GT715_02070 [Clostridium beijerinckii]|uniref:Uncharacterized protein n=1 Tax=Clostridium beijerinckii TaxID=1520 RepID=A0A1S9N2R1_CLOBE|nr:hypothetical protein [Clostridium beijerinckii]MZK49202.1 hypothetical protein [Clostridium beijerinckii]MZK57033.1 hypothetical protein [Clostridium beijerinckii]MZK67244.1 hypothetical protein [Clostridium beijerinckii]MZK82467.1 hypothetical protein [Clostridium beijerinckii]MZK96660.1 hypothetical protein [Clostridium beijerinckii]
MDFNFIKELVYKCKNGDMLSIDILAVQLYFPKLSSLRAPRLLNSWSSYFHNYIINNTLLYIKN